jgi:hypothetical protein
MRVWRYGHELVREGKRWQQLGKLRDLVQRLGRLRGLVQLHGWLQRLDELQHHRELWFLELEWLYRDERGRPQLREE